MELVKREIRTTVCKAEKNVQITLDKDMNVPDSRPDVEKLIQSKGEIRLDEIEVMNERIRVKGVLYYKGLYHTAEAGPMFSSLTGILELEEYINADGITINDSVKVTAELDDLNVMLIHSRKLGIRALITLSAEVSETKRVEGAIGTEGEPVEQLFSDVNLTQLAFQKRDICRIKGGMTLAQSKPNIRELIWDNAALRNPEVRMMEGRIQIRGEVHIFYLYSGEEEHVPIQHIEWEMPFTVEITCPECRDDMVGHVQVSLGSYQLEVKPDEDGEERNLIFEATLNLDMKGYEEEKVSLLEDVYSTEKKIDIIFTPFEYENLIVKNNAKTKVHRRISWKEMKGKILQLIHVDGCVKVDEVECREDGIYVEGVILADLLMITDDDYQPLYGATQILPFSHLVEVRNVGEKDKFKLSASLETIHGTMPDSDEVDLKAIVSLDVIAFAERAGKTITQMTEHPYEYEQMKQIPGIAVYIAEKEEPVWNVAKAYLSTVEEIRKMNQLDSTMLKSGQRIMITKKVREVL